MSLMVYSKHQAGIIRMLIFCKSRESRFLFHTKKVDQDFSLLIDFVLSAPASIF